MEEDMENNAEATAAKGMEVNKRVEGRLAAWKKDMLAKNAVSKEYMTAWNKIKASATEGSFRQHVLEKLTPIIENSAFSRGLNAESTKWTLKGVGVVCSVAGLVGLVVPEIGVPAKVVGAVTGLAAMVGEAPEKFGAKFVGKYAEQVGKVGLVHKVDGVVDKIVGWRGPKMV